MSYHQSGNSKVLLPYTLVCLGLVTLIISGTETGQEWGFEISNFMRDMLNLL
jgi:hypothetical protein